jgi:hypothetical protein
MKTKMNMNEKVSRIGNFAFFHTGFNNPYCQMDAQDTPFNNRSGEVVVLGSSMIDFVAYTSTLPAQGETVLGSEFAKNFGGKGANQVIQISGQEITQIITVFHPLD